MPESIHQAALAGNVDRILAELAAGVSVDITMQDDTTPLHSAAGAGHLGALKALIEKGPDSFTVFGRVSGGAMIGLWCRGGREGSQRAAAVGTPHRS